MKATAFNSVDNLLHHIGSIQTMKSENRPLQGPIKQCEKAFCQNGQWLAKPDMISAQNH